MFFFCNLIGRHQMYVNFDGDVYHEDEQEGL